MHGRFKTPYTTASPSFSVLQLNIPPVWEVSRHHRQTELGEVQLLWYGTGERHDGSISSLECLQKYKPILKSREISD